MLASLLCKAWLQRGNSNFYIDGAKTLFLPLLCSPQGCIGLGKTTWAELSYDSRAKGYLVGEWGLMNTTLLNYLDESCLMIKLYTSQPDNSLDGLDGLFADFNIFKSNYK